MLIKNKKKIQPVLRYPGSKFRKIDKIISILEPKEDSKFLDLFGGSGIVGINVKHLIGCKTWINDYDNILGHRLTKQQALINMTSFGGLGKNITPGALRYFATRIENGYWDKLEIYKEKLLECDITRYDFTEPLSHVYFNTYDCVSHIYADPPYDDIKGLYKSDFNKNDHERLKDNLQLITDEDRCRILISYNDTPFIRELYKDWYIKEEEYKYQTGRGYKKKKVNELWITNFDWKEEDE